MDVAIRCLCPDRADGTPRHPDGDTVTLRDRLDFRQAMAVRGDLDALRLQTGGTASEGEYAGLLAESYLFHGITSWTLVDDKGKALPPSRDNIRSVLMADYEEAEKVADGADSLYTEKVVLPLLVRGSSSSVEPPTETSTSPTTDGGSEPPTPSSPTSISTIPTAATGTTSRKRAGGSKPSQSSASAA